MTKKDSTRVLARNKKAKHEYLILESLEAGVAFTGTEVKSARTGTVQLRESFIEFRDGEAWLVGAHIGPYSHGNRANHIAERPRKLLLSRREMDRLSSRAQAKGLTVVPLSLYLKGSWIKLEIALVQGKKLHDKRETERRRELEREAQEAIKGQRW